jgi:hypothetical protein
MDPGTAIGLSTTVITLAITCISLLCGLVITVAAIGIPIYIMRNNQKKMQNLAATGIQGEATVLQLEDTGMRINDDPRVAVTLEVRLPGYPPYQVRKTVTLPLIRMSQVQVGAVIGVVADPSQPGNPDKVGLLLR